MKNLKVFLSYNENSLDAGLKIKNESYIKTEIIYIEEFIKQKKYNSITDDDIIHFSCNSDLIYKIIHKIENVKCYIFNKGFLLKRYEKKDIQLILKANNIKVPTIYYNFDGIPLPAFCKENRHTGILFKAFTETTLKEIFKKFNKKNFYFEEDVANNDCTAKEIKVYYVNNETFGRNNEKVCNDIKIICDKIAEYFHNLEIFSADFIKNSSGIYLIDLNPAVGFYLSDNGRKKFLDNVVNVKGDSN